MKEKIILSYEEIRKRKKGEKLYQIEFRYTDSRKTYISIITESQLNTYIKLKEDK